MLPFSLFKSKSKSKPKSSGKGKEKEKEKEKEQESKKLRASVQRRFEGRAREMEREEEYGRVREYERGHVHEQQQQHGRQEYGHKEGREYRDHDHDHGREMESRSATMPSTPSFPTAAGGTGERTRSVSYSSVEGGRMGNVKSKSRGKSDERPGGGQSVGRSGSVLSYQPSGRKGSGRRDPSPSPSLLVSGREGGGGEKRGKEEKERRTAETRAKEGRVVDEIRRLTHHPSITVVNVNERVSPCIYRVDGYGIWKQAQARMGVDEEEKDREDREWKTMKEAARAGVVGTTENVLRLAKFLAEEAESIVSMEVSARSMSVVASFRRDGWEQRIGVALGGT